MLKDMGIHFGGRSHDEGRSVAKRLYVSTMPRPESHKNGLSENGSCGDEQGLGEDLLCVNLPPLPPIERWLVEPENRSDRETQNIDHALEFDDFDSVIEKPSNEDSSRQSASVQRTIPRFVFKPTQAVVVILILVVALCASLTMLVTQAINYNKQQTEASPVSSTVVDGSKTKSPGQGQGNSSKGESAAGSTATSAGSGGQGSGTGSMVISANPSAQSGSSGGQAGTPNASGNLVNINTADSTQLQQIKGVGPVMAQKIIDYRTSIGHFTSVDQLLKVSGIGQKTLEKIRGQVTV